MTEKGKLFQGDIDVETSLDISLYGDGTVSLAGRLNFTRPDDIIISQGISTTSSGTDVIKFDNRVGEYNMIIGFDALQSLVPVASTSGYKNIAIGKSALSSTVNGTNNIAIGLSAMTGMIDIYGNVAVGELSLSSNTAALDILEENTALGFKSGQTFQSGNYNTFIGAESGNNVNTGTDNIFVGVLSGADSSLLGTINNAIAIGNGALVEQNGWIQLGVRGVASIGAKLKFRSQIVSSESWRGTPDAINSYLAYIDAEGNLNKSLTFLIDEATGKLTVPGLLDPTGLQLTPVVANPGDAYTLWVNSVGGVLYYGPNPVGGGGGGTINPGTDNHIVRYNGTGTTVVQDSLLVITDTGILQFLPTTAQLLQIQHGTTDYINIYGVADGNIKIGEAAGSGIIYNIGVSGIFNIVIGNNSMNAVNNSSIACLSIGPGSLSAATQEIGDIAIGYQTLTNVNNPVPLSHAGIAIGFTSLASLLDGTDNVAVGYSTMNILEHGIGNTAIGSSALAELGLAGGVTVFVYNTGVGFESGRRAHKAEKNTFMGAYADVNIGTPDINNTTAIGYNAKTTQNYQFQLGENAATVGKLGQLFFKSQLVSQESWIGNPDALNSYLAYIDASGNLTKSLTFLIDEATGKLTVPGLLDPTGLQLTPVASNPGNAYTIWTENVQNYLRYNTDNVVIGPVINTGTSIPVWNSAGNTNKIESTGVLINAINELSGATAITLSSTATKISEFATDSGMGYPSPSNNKLATQKAIYDFVKNEESTYFNLLNEPTGMTSTSRAGTTLACTTRASVPSMEFSITPTGASFDYWINGVQYIKTTTQTLTISDVEGLHYIYFNGSSLNESTVFSVNLLRSYAFVCILYWDFTNGIPLLIGDERHEFMQWETHYNMHRYHGTVYISGLALNSITADGGPIYTDALAQLGVDAGAILDEDIQHSILARAFPSSFYVFYYINAGGVNGWRAYANALQGAPVVKGVNRLYYNTPTVVGGLTEVPSNNRFVLAHILATNAFTTTKQVIALMGQNVYTSITSAREGAATEISTMITAGLPLAECLFMATLIYETSSLYGTTYNARIRTIDGSAKYVNWLQYTINASTSPAAHSSLSGLGPPADDHIQYMLVPTGAVLDNTTARWDSTSGRYIQSSGVVIDDSNNVTGVASLTAGTIHITGKLTVDGLIDPTGMEFVPVSENPGIVGKNTIWIDSSNRLFKLGSDPLISCKSWEPMTQGTLVQWGSPGFLESIPITYSKEFEELIITGTTGSTKISGNMIKSGIVLTQIQNDAPVLGNNEFCIFQNTDGEIIFANGGIQHKLIFGAQNNQNVSIPFNCPSWNETQYAQTQFMQLDGTNILKISAIEGLSNGNQFDEIIAQVNIPQIGETSQIIPGVIGTSRALFCVTIERSRISYKPFNRTPTFAGDLIKIDGHTLVF